MYSMLSLVWSFLLVLGCTAAVIGYHTWTEEKCSNEKRLVINLDANLQICGDCLTGYTERYGSCVKHNSYIDKCPSDRICSQKGRRPCTDETDGNCGSCLPEYLYIKGMCITEEDVDKLIFFIQRSLDEDVTPETTLETTRETRKFMDRKSQSHISTGSKSDPLQISGASPDMSNSAKRLSDSSPVVSNIGSESLPAAAPIIHFHHGADNSKTAINQLIFYVIICSASVICITILIIAGVVWYRLHQRHKATQSKQYAGYQGEYTPSNMTKSDSGDRKLAHSAQMYHYQHQRQKLIALEKSLNDKLDNSDVEDEAPTGAEGEYTVFMCPGLAPTGEMEVQNPVFLASKISSSSSCTSPEALSPTTATASSINTSTGSEPTTDLSTTTDSEQTEPNTFDTEPHTQHSEPHTHLP